MRGDLISYHMCLQNDVTELDNLLDEMADIMNDDFNGHLDREQTLAIKILSEKFKTRLEMINTIDFDKVLINMEKEHIVKKLRQSAKGENEDE